MKFERVGLIYASIAVLSVVIFVPVALFFIAPVMSFASDSIATILDYILAENNSAPTQMFSKALVVSFTISFLTFMGLSKLISFIKSKKASN